MQIAENGIYMNLVLEKGKAAAFTHFSRCPQKEAIAQEDLHVYTLAEMQASGFDQCDHHGNKHTGSSPSLLMKYETHTDHENEYGRKLEIQQDYEGLKLITHMQFYRGIPVVRCWNELKNQGEKTYSVEYLSSFAFTGLSVGCEQPRDKNAWIYVPHNTWFGEAQWKKYTLNELGYDVVNTFSMKRISYSKTGSWGCDEFLPMGCYYNTETDTSMTWEIETSGSWHWEISDIREQLYLQISGPTFQENGWMINLHPGESFASVPCAVAVTEGEFQDSIGAMTQYRRRIRRQNKDNETLPVIFNDYMNCLMGDPTTDVLKPLIDAAKEAGGEYFCVDCGWYSDGHWWDGVGEWLPSKKRFPGGIEEVIQYIRSRDMIPGLWLELEVMGTKCPMVDKVPKDWFFQRNGQAVIDHCRYQLDFRNPQVQEYAMGVIRRLVEEYGVGYIKMDYNIDCGVGTDRDADSAGAGLLEHNRAYLAWLDRVFETYPDLIIENCSSGGMRMEYSMLSRQSIQSVTDQTDYIKMAAIAANCATACAPEQAAIWSYPLIQGTEEEAVFNMVNAMLLRIHQSGYLGQIGEGRMRRVTDGIRCYKEIREDIKEGIPFWPTGLASFSDEYLSYGMQCQDRCYLAVWRTQGEGEKEFCIPLHKKGCQIKDVRCMYPVDMKTDHKYEADTECLRIKLEPKTARLFAFSRIG